VGVFVSRNPGVVPVWRAPPRGLDDPAWDVYHIRLHRDSSAIRERPIDRQEVAPEGLTRSVRETKLRGSLGNGRGAEGRVALVDAVGGGGRPAFEDLTIRVLVGCAFVLGCPRGSGATLLRYPGWGNKANSGRRLLGRPSGTSSIELHQTNPMESLILAQDERWRRA
jgi:hypothetical protein